MSALGDIDWLFSGRHFDREVIVLCVRWCVRYKLSLRDLVEMMAERGLSLAHTTIMRWVKCFTPEFVKRWNRFAMPAGQSWRVDETYVKIRGKWAYLYRAVDRAGKSVGFRLSARRDVAVAKAFFAKAIRSQGRAPKTITPDGYLASHRAGREMKTDGLLPDDTRLRSSNYLNNLIEQDHRFISMRCARAVEVFLDKRRRTRQAYRAATSRDQSEAGVGEMLRDVRGQQFVDAVGLVIRNVREHEFQVGAWIDVVQFAPADHSIHGGGFVK